MNFNDVKKLAKKMNINTYRLKRSDVIRSIQRAEKNIDCFATDRAIICNEMNCLWRDDCLKSQSG